MNQSIILKIIQDQIWIDINHQSCLAYIKGQLRLHDFKPAVGDLVEYEQINQDQYIITNILERKNFLIRPKVANIDLVCIIQSTISPDFDSNWLDKMICFYEQFNVDIVLIITKSDISINDHILETLNDYKKMHYAYFLSNNPLQYEQMLAYFKNKVVCFVGNSGVGKSTLINKINPNLNLKTQDTSKALNRGKHTTTNTQLIDMQEFYLIDTPGYATVSLKFKQLNLAHLFFHKLLNNDYCKFHDCLHLENAKDCKILNFLEQGILIKWRYEHYLNLLNSKEVKEYDQFKKSKY